MYMKENEILAKYRRADNKREQIRVLAELNLCSENEIIALLEKNGVPKTEIPSLIGKKRGPARNSKLKNKEVTQNMDTEKNNIKTSESVETSEAIKIPDEVIKLVKNRVNELNSMITDLEIEREKLESFMKEVN